MNGGEEIVADEPTAGELGERAIDALLRDDYAQIRRLAWRFGLPEDEIDDATQEVFAKVWLHYAKFRGDCAPATWLTRIAVNSFTSRRRALVRRFRMFRQTIAADDGVPTRSPVDPAVRDAYERAVACVGRLPVKVRQVFVLRYLEDMSAVEVAETLGIPEATVRSRAFLARKRLQQMMKGCEPW